MTAPEIDALCAWLDGAQEPVISHAELSRAPWAPLVPALLAAGILVAGDRVSELPCKLGLKGCRLVVEDSPRRRPDGTSRWFAACVESNRCGERMVEADERTGYRLVSPKLTAWLRREICGNTQVEPSSDPLLVHLGFRRLPTSGVEHTYLRRALPAWRWSDECDRMRHERGDARIRVVTASVPSAAEQRIAGRANIEVTPLEDLVRVENAKLVVRLESLVVAEDDETVVAELFEVVGTGLKSRLIDGATLSAIRASRDEYDLFADEKANEVWRKGVLDSQSVYGPWWTVYRRALDRRSAFHADEVVDESMEETASKRFREVRNALDVKLGARTYAIIQTRDKMYFVEPQPSHKIAYVFVLRNRYTDSA